MPSLRSLAELVRAPAALSVPGDVVAGGAAGGVLGPRTAGLAAASVCLYWSGMAANDWADRDLDAVERPERPIPSGRITPPEALGVAAGLTAAGIALAALAGGRRALAVALPLAGAVWAYDLRAKNTPAGPAVMAACRGLDVLLGASPGRVVRAVPAALTVAAHTYTVTALSRREVSGADRALPAATLAGTAAVALSASLPAARNGRGAAAAVPGALAAWYAAGYGAAQARVAADPSAARVRAAVGAGITGLPPLQGALAASAGAPATGVVVAAFAPLARRLARIVSPT
ncbi:UbiA family prenyltransferase [Phytohabitans flavus]|uniref:Transferase n=1 Tax=Phytohabitans flavus TaxID=1076124 RepID=A0A6F8XZB9_9ACTN|nr:UbiA family prenyltransferase [Phytohabitans flavus]BCB79196.1 transferase [Phytohabitans flavus]